MKKVYKIAHTELQTLFYSPIAWLILVIFAAQTGTLFTGSFEQALKRQLMGDNWAGYSYWIFEFRQMLEYIYLYVPLLTMGLMSREISSGSIKLLYSSPVSNVQIILGKYLSMMIYGLVLVAILTCFALFGAFTIKNMDIPTVLTGLFGIYLLICTFAAIGLFMSCITSYQVVAAMGTLALFAGLNYISHVGQGIELVRDITYWLSITGRANEFIAGLINSEDVLYFLIVISLFIVLSIFKLDTDKFKNSFSRNALRFSGAVLVAVTLGYITSRPKMMSFYDATRTKMNTLTPKSQAVVKQITDGLTITTYVNLFENNYYQGLPYAVNFDREHFKQYIRFKPDIKMKYVYYYDPNTDAATSMTQYPGLTAKQRMEKVCTVMDLDPKLFHSPEEMTKILDLSQEHHRFIRILERENGKKAYLRLFDDMMKQPGESEISAAFKRVAMKLPTVGFLQGHEARDIDNFGDRGYNDFARNGPLRSSLVNQGFDVTNLDLSHGDKVPADINILVIADIKSPLTESENAVLDEYIERGGNLLIMGEPGRQEVMNPLTARFGVSFMPGQVVQTHDKNYLPNLLFLQPTKQAVDMSYIFEDMTYGGAITMPGVTGLTYSQNKGYTVTPWFMTQSKGSWNELQTKNFVDEKPVADSLTGEKETAIPIVLALSREQKVHPQKVTAGQLLSEGLHQENERKQQKIIVMGDADCLSNAELSANRKGVPAMNGQLVKGIFYWLSDEEVPIDTRRPRLTDNDLGVTLTGMSVTKLFFVWILPGLLAITGILIWVIRKRR